MRQIITVISDNAVFQLEEEAYAALRQYLDRAKAGLRNNPDVTEILGDLERSISEKCLEAVRFGRTVLRTEDVHRILEQMGPVGEDIPTDSEDDASKESATPRKLYAQPEGAKLSGVCTGLAEYLGIDVVLVRVGFIALALMGGIGVLAYLVLEFLMPSRGPSRRFMALKLCFLAAALISALTWYSSHGGKAYGAVRTPAGGISYDDSIYNLHIRGSADRAGIRFPDWGCGIQVPALHGNSRPALNRGESRLRPLVDKTSQTGNNRLLSYESERVL